MAGETPRSRWPAATLAGDVVGSPQHADSVLRPGIGRLKHAAGFAPADGREERLGKLEALLAPMDPPAEDVALFAELLSVATIGRWPDLDFAPQRRRALLLRALARRVRTDRPLSAAGGGRGRILARPHHPRAPPADPSQPAPPLRAPGRARATPPAPRRSSAAPSAAREQGARTWELRAACSLARLLRDQGRMAEAREPLRPVNVAFTEGFGFPDLVEARALLGELEVALTRRGKSEPTP